VALWGCGVQDWLDPHLRWGNETGTGSRHQSRHISHCHPNRSGTRRGSPHIKPRGGTLVVPGFADFLAADEDAVWTTNEGRVDKLRHDRSAPVASVSMPGPCGAMTVAFHALWVAGCTDSSVYRIELRAQQISAIIPTGLEDPSGELSLAAGAKSVWVLTDPKGVLSRIDPRTNRVVARIEVAPHSYAAAFGYGAVWITNTGADTTRVSGSVQRIDPGINKVIATIPVGPIPRFLAVGEGGVWTLNQGDGSVTRIDPRNNQPVATVALAMRGPGGDIATGGGRVWVRGTRVLLASVDPATNRVMERFGPPAGSGAVRVARDLVWVTAHDIHTVWVLKTRP
jgi:YVTN family beta-propeller protein